MPEDTEHTEAEQAEAATAETTAAAPPADEEVPRRADRHRKPGKHRRRRWWSILPDDPNERRRLRMRRVANLMIIAGVLGLLGIVFYFVGTCAYTAREQEELRAELAEANPELAAAEAGVSEEGFFSRGAWAEESWSGALAEAEAEYQAKLAALKFSAEYYRGESVVLRAGQPIGRIVIPKIGVDAVVVEGVLGGSIDYYLRKGPAHWPETKLPGAGGNVVISGHRTTYGAHFRELDELELGDVIELWMPYGVVRYKVTDVFIVDDEATETVADQGKEQVFLVACHPLSSSTQRIIAEGDMVSFYLYEPEE